MRCSELGTKHFEHFLRNLMKRRYEETRNQERRSYVEYVFQASSCSWFMCRPLGREIFLGTQLSHFDIIFNEGFCELRDPPVHLVQFLLLKGSHYVRVINPVHPTYQASMQSIERESHRLNQIQAVLILLGRELSRLFKQLLRRLNPSFTQTLSPQFFSRRCSVQAMSSISLCISIVPNIYFDSTFKCGIENMKKHLKMN